MMTSSPRPNLLNFTTSSLVIAASVALLPSAARAGDARVISSSTINDTYRPTTPTLFACLARFISPPSLGHEVAEDPAASPLHASGRALSIGRSCLSVDSEPYNILYVID